MRSVKTIMDPDGIVHLQNGNWAKKKPTGWKGYFYFQCRFIQQLGVVHERRGVVTCLRCVLPWKPGRR